MGGSQGGGVGSLGVTSSLMSVSTAVFSASLRQMLSRGLSLLLVMATGDLSTQHSPGLPWEAMAQLSCCCCCCLAFLPTLLPLFGLLSPFHQLLFRHRTSLPTHTHSSEPREGF